MGSFNAAVRIASSMLAASAGAVLAGGCASYGDPSRCHDAACREQAQFTSGLERSLRSAPDLAPPEAVYAQTLDNVVYLTGHVTTVVQRDHAEAIARSAIGDRELVDNLVVTANSGR